MKRLQALIPVFVLSVAVPFVPQALAAPDTTCTGTIGSGTVPGKLVVPPGATCTLDGTTVLGTIEVGSSATLRASRIKVETAEIQATGFRQILITNGSVVDGLQAKDGGAVTITGSTFEGQVQLQKNTGRVNISSNSLGEGVQITETSDRVTFSGNSLEGSSAEITKTTGTLTVKSNRVGENLEVSETQGQVTVSSNRVNDNLEVSKNLGGTTISSNTVGDNLSCSDNSPPPTGGGNVAGADGNGSKDGQCAGL